VTQELAITSIHSSLTRPQKDSWSTTNALLTKVTVRRFGVGLFVFLGTTVLTRESNNATVDPSDTKRSRGENSTCDVRINGPSTPAGITSHPVLDVELPRWAVALICLVLLVGLIFGALAITHYLDLFTPEYPLCACGGIHPVASATTVG
jgi:hypothetical protein